MDMPVFRRNLWIIICSNISDVSQFYPSNRKCQDYVYVKVEYKSIM